MISHGRSVCGHANTAGTALLHSQSGLQFHHDAVDADDFDESANPGTRGDISTWLATFRNGLASQFGDSIDPSLIDFVAVGSALLIFHGTQYVGIAHVDDRTSPPRVVLADIDHKFKSLVSSMVGVVSR